MDSILEKTVIQNTAKFTLAELDTNGNLGYEVKSEGKKVLEKNRLIIQKEADKLFANKKHALLIIIQAMDAAKKDSTIKHVFSGLQPQILSAAEFKEPTSTELKHDYLWRINQKLPRRGQIGIFNRSHYEEVIVTRVHPDLILNQNIPGISKPDHINEEFWKERYNQINQFEKYLQKNGYVIVKFFLHMSREKQRKRFLRRIRREDKHWKFALKDIEERQHWQEYQQAYEKVLQETSTDMAPWHVIPADRKWVIRAAVSQVTVKYLNDLNLRYPMLSDKEQDQLKRAKKMLEKEY